MIQCKDCFWWGRRGEQFKKNRYETDPEFRMCGHPDVEGALVIIHVLDEEIEAGTLPDEIIRFKKDFGCIKGAITQ